MSRSRTITQVHDLQREDSRVANEAPRKPHWRDTPGQRLGGETSPDAGDQKQPGNASATQTALEPTPTATPPESESTLISKDPQTLYEPLRKRRPKSEAETATTPSPPKPNWKDTPGQRLGGKIITDHKDQKPAASVSATSTVPEPTGIAKKSQKRYGRAIKRHPKKEITPNNLQTAADAVTPKPNSQDAPTHRKAGQTTSDLKDQKQTTSAPATPVVSDSSTLISKDPHKLYKWFYNKTRPEATTATTQIPLHQRPGGQPSGARTEPPVTDNKKDSKSSTEVFHSNMQNNKGIFDPKTRDTIVKVFDIFHKYKKQQEMPEHELKWPSIDPESPEFDPEYKKAIEETYQIHMENRQLGPMPSGEEQAKIEEKINAEIAAENQRTIQRLGKAMDLLEDIATYFARSVAGQTNSQKILFRIDPEVRKKIVKLEDLASIRWLPEKSQINFGNSSDSDETNEKRFLTEMRSWLANQSEAYLNSVADVTMEEKDLILKWIDLILEKKFPEQALSFTF